MSTRHTLAAVTAFAVAMAFVEAAVVVYLRSLYYPEGFAFPLVIIPGNVMAVELLRELATIVMIAAVALIAGRTNWERFGYFSLQFGIWDIFYYVWLKATLNWPPSLLDWDILFLIPAPWTGPVLAPVLVSLVLIAAGLMIIRCTHLRRHFTPGPTAWLLSILATALVLASFLSNARAVVCQQPPGSYWYGALAAGLLCYATAIWTAWRNCMASQSADAEDGS
jgi:hypothetical protein